MGAAGAVAAVETLEDELEVHLGDADARVEDLDPRLGGRGGDANPDLPARFRVADGVLDQVVEDLLHPIAVDKDSYRLLRDLDREFEVLVHDSGKEVSRDVRNELGQIRVGEGERYAAGLAAGEEEQVLGETCQVPDLEQRVAH